MRARGKKTRSIGSVHKYDFATETRHHESRPCEPKEVLNFFRQCQVRRRRSLNRKPGEGETIPYAKIFHICEFITLVTLD